jgi:hypothetical protein
MMEYAYLSCLEALIVINCNSIVGHLSSKIPLCGKGSTS